MNTSTYRFTVGTTECAVVSDGTFTYHEPGPIFFVSAAKSEVDEALRQAGIQPDSWQELVSPYTGLLVQTGGQRVLLDAGADGMAPTTGQLPANLRAAGVAPEDIDLIVLSHAHADHLGGVLGANGTLAFPNARYVLSRDEWEYWTAAPSLAALELPPPLKDLIRTWAGNGLAAIRDRVELVERETEVAPGVPVLPAPGHTPGHLAVAVSSGGEQLLYAGDAALHPIHLQHPDWYAAVDIVREQVAGTRRRLFDRAAADRALVHVFHFPFPCLGHVVARGNGWEWLPIQDEGA